MKRILVSIASAVCALGLPAPAIANPQLAAISGARANMEVLPSGRIRGSAFPYDHAVTIALPASYQVQPDKSYPVLWVLDDPLMDTVFKAQEVYAAENDALEAELYIGAGGQAG